MRTSREQSNTVKKPRYRDHRRSSAATLIAGALVFLVSAAQSHDFDDSIATLNEQVMLEGPIPGRIAEEIPEQQAVEEMTAVGDELSDGLINTPAPTSAAQFAIESTELNLTPEDLGANLNLDSLQDNGKVDVPTGAEPSPLFGAQPFSQMMLRFEELGGAVMGEPN